MSVDMRIQERILEVVISHQMDSALEAMKRCDSIEFSGWGKFYYNKPKAKRKIDKLENKIRLFSATIEDPRTTPLRKRNAEIKLEEAVRDLAILKSRTNESETCVGGMEESSVPSGEAEGRDRESAQGEDGDM